ncbi:MAG: hypothetical protein ACJA0E_001773 [Bermanella sp.]|jgi:hypothetical protein
MYRPLRLEFSGAAWVLWLIKHNIKGHNIKGQVFDFGFHINKSTKTSKIAQLNNPEITPCLSGKTGVYDVECERSLLNNALIKL